jgi:hypothetical protein
MREKSETRWRPPTRCERAPPTSRRAARSALLSSHTGALLYPHVGYEPIGELMIYTPKKNGT